jgi:plasmid maintenance system antidote protein VapI
MEWQNIVKTVAPWIGTAIGGPLGGMSVEAIANALGVSEKTTERIQQAIQGMTPAEALALKKADQDFALQMRSLGYKNVADLEKIAADDRDSARKMQMSTRSMMPALLTCGVGLTFGTVLLVLFKHEIPDNNRDVVVYMCGQLAAAFAGCLAFWTGTTRQSENKTEIIATQTKVTH